MQPLTRVEGVLNRLSLLLRVFVSLGYRSRPLSTFKRFLDYNLSVSM